MDTDQDRGEQLLVHCVATGENVRERYARIFRAHDTDHDEVFRGIAKAARAHGWTYDERRQRLFRSVALAQRVLVVYSIDLLGMCWAAYIDAVPGKSHDAEAARVAAQGGKLRKQLARQISSNPLLAVFRWRD